MIFLKFPWFSLKFLRETVLYYHDRPRPSTTAGDPWDVDPAVIKRPSPVVTQHQQQQQQQFIDLLKKKTAEQVRYNTLDFG